MQPRSPLRVLPLALLLAAVGLFAGCQSAYYGAMEKLGYEKRDILVDRVEDARDAQEAAKEQFTSALDQFRSIVRVEGGELAERYDAMATAFERSQRRAEAVEDRIASVEGVAEALFEEWEEELEEYADPGLRRQSTELLETTRDRYGDMIVAMRRAARKMEPVLEAFQDQVLFLKHNLNARAIAALQGELEALEGEIAALIDDMERSIDEANAFIEQMQGD